MPILELQQALLLQLLTLTASTVTPKPRVIMYCYGALTLTSNDGGTISIEDGEQDTHTGLATLGLQAQSEAVDTTSEGLSVGSVANATAALSCY